MKKSFGEKIKALFSKRSSINDDFYEELTDLLVEGDIGAKTSFLIVDELEEICSKEKITDQNEIMLKLKELLLEDVKAIDLNPDTEKQNVWMVLGVNGVGKTTSVAKLAKWYKEKVTENVVLASADTFRAAAIEQLAMHGEKIGVRVVSHQHGSDPSAVVYDAADALKSKGPGLVLADTAGRLHNKENLVRELQKIDKTCRTKADEGCYKKIIVIDATTGQNALRQVEVFNEAVGVDAVIITKYDSTAKGGVLVSIGKELKIPVAFVCTGEKYENISMESIQKLFVENHIYFPDFIINGKLYEINTDVDEKASIIGIEAMRDFYISLGIPTSLREVGITESDLPELIRLASCNGTRVIGLYPQPLNESDIEAVYALCLK